MLETIKGRSTRVESELQAQTCSSVTTEGFDMQIRFSILWASKYKHQHK